MTACTEFTNGNERLGELGVSLYVERTLDIRWTFVGQSLITNKCSIILQCMFYVRPNPKVTPYTPLYCFSTCIIFANY
ncbi:hypothetical protein SAMN05518672_10993 [Chitinophaga sp. CF118]|nr:hypothetical protein SAMN05518672_10993 [Chitinophaga sp. CF118]